MPTPYEQEIGSDPTNADSDNDGLPDGVEVLNSFSPLSPQSEQYQDSDGDGVSDTVEGALGSDASAVDTDRDGLSDALELLYQLDPYNPDTDQDGIVDGYDSSPHNFRFTNKLWHFEK